MLGGSDIKKMAAGLLQHHHAPSQQDSPTSASASSLVTPESASQEKQFVAQFSGEQAVLPPDEIQKDPRNKELGVSSKSLSLRDFELVRTLGTGAFPTAVLWRERRLRMRCQLGRLLMRPLRVLGTFARVWLVRLANPSEQDRDKVYALKVLRKAESAYSPSRTICRDVVLC